MSVSSEQSVYFVITLVTYAIFFYWGLDFAFRFPKRALRARAKGKSFATEKTVRLVKVIGLFLVVYTSVGILYMLFVYLTGRIELRFSN